MEIIDIIILLLIGVGVIQGLMKGSIKELASIVGFVAGLLLARALFGTVAQQLAPALGTSITIAQKKPYPLSSDRRRDQSGGVRQSV